MATVTTHPFDLRMGDTVQLVTCGQQIQLRTDAPSRVKVLPFQIKEQSTKKKRTSQDVEGPHQTLTADGLGAGKGVWDE